MIMKVMTNTTKGSETKGTAGGVMRLPENHDGCSAMLVGDFAAEAARIAEAIGFIDELPEGWDTNIGEDGHRLSGGQRQRIAIARAVLKDAPVLVLDEATSNVDNETEAALQRSIERISRDRTTLIIAHRLSTIRNADTIAVMEKGQITEMGSHDELVSQEGLYARLWAVQTGEASE